MHGQRRRTQWVLGLVTVCFLALIGRLFLLQVRVGPEWVRRAVDQRMLALPLAPRGTIRDRWGQPLHDPRLTWAVAAFPSLLPARDGQVAAAMAQLLGLPVTDVQSRLDRAGRQPIWLGRGLSPATALAAARDRPGLAAAPLADRYGPASLARHAVGYVNVSGGQLGLEARWNHLLTGTAGPHLAAYVDAAGRPLAGLGIRRVEVTAGPAPADLHLTLDARVQAVVEQVLDRAPTPPGGGPLRAAAVVLSARTGEVLAMASRPQFNQDTGPDGIDATLAPLLNRAVAAYPPGSVFKPVAMAAALAAGRLPDLHERVQCSGHYDLGGERFTEPQAGGHGEITWNGALAQSCNIAFIQLGYERLGRDLLLEWASRFGFGRPTGSGLPEEAAGVLPPARYGGEVAQLAFGQGLTVTPVQVARAYAALAGDGTLPAVGLVRKVTAPDGEVLLRPERGPRVRVLPVETARQMADALRTVTTPDGAGTGQRAWVVGAGSAGKTGTAQAVAAGRAVSHAWFAGWSPVERPALVGVVLVEEGGSGGDTAAPLFAAIMRQALTLPRLP